jgi:hypothetical protein
MMFRLHIIKFLQEKCREQGFLRHGYSLEVIMVVTATGVSPLRGKCSGRIRKRAPIKQEKACSFENQAHMGKSVLYEIIAGAEEIAELIAPMIICLHRHNNVC